MFVINVDNMRKIDELILLYFPHEQNDEMLKHDSKSQDDLFKGLHYERNQVKSQVYIGQAYEFLL